jgi:hypothetical protein
MRPADLAYFQPTATTIVVGPLPGPLPVTTLKPRRPVSAPGKAPPGVSDGNRGGGFSFWLEAPQVGAPWTEARLLVESWRPGEVRPDQRHAITSRGSEVRPIQ